MDHAPGALSSVLGLRGGPKTTANLHQAIPQSSNLVTPQAIHASPLGEFECARKQRRALSRDPLWLGAQAGGLGCESVLKYKGVAAVFPIQTYRIFRDEGKAHPILVRLTSGG